MRYTCLDKNIIDSNGGDVFEVDLVYGDGMNLICKNRQHQTSVFYTNEEINRWFVSEKEIRTKKIKNILNYLG